jgi:hypothetical protein
MASWGNKKQAKPIQTGQIDDYVVRSSGNLLCNIINEILNL